MNVRLIGKSLSSYLIGRYFSPEATILQENDSKGNVARAVGAAAVTSRTPVNPIRLRGDDNHPRLRSGNAEANRSLTKPTEEPLGSRLQTGSPAAMPRVFMQLSTTMIIGTLNDI